MTASTRDSLLRAAIVVLLGVGVGLAAIALGRLQRAAAAEEGLGVLEERLATAGAGDWSPEDPLGTVVRDRITERYVFSEKPRERFRQVRGVLGNRVLFESGQSAEVGEEVDGARVLAVEAESVRFRKDGQEVEIQVAAGGESGAGGTPPGGDAGDAGDAGQGSQAGR